MRKNKKNTPEKIKVDGYPRFLHAKVTKNGDNDNSPSNNDNRPVKTLHAGCKNQQKQKHSLLLRPDHSQALHTHQKNKTQTEEEKKESQ